METTMRPETQQLLDTALALPREQRRWVRNQAQRRACEEQGRHFMTEEEFLDDLKQAFEEFKLMQKGKLKMKTMDEYLAAWKEEEELEKRKAKRKEMAEV